jgi:hypothetical protein
MAKKSNSQLRIEKNVPIPRRTHGLAAILRKMKSGECVLVQTSLSSAHSTARFALGAGKVAVRTEAGGVRVWVK